MVHYIDRDNAIVNFGNGNMFVIAEEIRVGEWVHHTFREPPNKHEVGLVSEGTYKTCEQAMEAGIERAKAL